jgi:Bacterial Ig-like domain (group 3)/Abnormal spindle-like microcephaly-assoc'd, ASPM-SPD-2-Hydin
MELRSDPKSMPVRLIVAALLCLATVFAQESDPTSYPIRHVSRPGGSVLGSKTRVGANSLQSLATVETLPFWAATAGSYTCQMIGNNPMVAQTSQSTTIPVPIVPGTCTAQSPLSLSLAFPLFGSLNYAPGGTSVGNTQFVDAFQRANFWKYTGPSGINPSYHILLAGSAATPITITVPAAYGTTSPATCGLLGRIELKWLDSYLQTTVFPQLATAGILPSHFPVFLLANVVMYQNTMATCCALGFHSDFNNPNFGGTVQTYAVADFDTSGSFSAATDINTLAHEVAEWLDDPLGSNPTPAWGRTGQVAGCRTNLEVADPLNGTSQNITMSNAYTYHVPELAFVSWFYKHVPSFGVNGWYSSNGTFTQPAATCYLSATTLSITPTTMAAGASATVTIKTAASGSIGTPTGKVTLNTSAAATVGTYALTKGAYTGTVAFPAGSYSVTANYPGDLSFGPSSSAAVALKVGAPTVSLSPISLTFASTAIGSSGTAQIITLANKGTAPLTGISVSLAGAAPRDFSRSTTCAATLAVNATCSISVTFKPTATGPRTASVSVADNSVPLTGTAVGTPTVSLSPTALTFASAPQVLTLTNKGTGDLTGISVSLGGAAPGDFSRTTTCPATLAVNATCSISVTFKPTVSGTRTATVSLTNNATGSPQLVPLTGTAVAATSPATAIISVTAFAFSSTPVGTSTAPQNVILMNTGSATLSGIAISITDSNPTDFPFTTTCAATLAAGSNCAIAVTFRPSAAGTRSATLNVRTALSSKAQTTTMSGPGVALAAPVVTLGASSLVFASTTIGTSTAAKTVTVTNSGTAPLTITRITIGGTTPVDYAQTNNCTTSLAVKASCTVSVVFKPTAKGNRSATLNIAGNATGSPRQVSLTGTGK